MHPTQTETHAGHHAVDAVRNGLTDARCARASRHQATDEQHADQQRNSHRARGQVQSADGRHLGRNPDRLRLAAP